MLISYLGPISTRNSFAFVELEKLLLLSNELSNGVSKTHFRASSSSIVRAVRTQLIDNSDNTVLYLDFRECSLNMGGGGGEDFQGGPPIFFARLEGGATQFFARS